MSTPVNRADFPYRRTSTISANFLKELKEVIANTTSDLNEHLQAIDSKLRAPVL